MGHAPSEYPTPDGYPLEAEPWTGSLFWRWNLAAALARGRVGATGIDRDRLEQATGSDEALVAHCLGRRPTTDELDAIRGSGDVIAATLASPGFQWF
jgi:hypothetical protein